MESSRAYHWRGDRRLCTCLLYTSDAADERSSVDLGGRRIIKKKNMCLSEWSAILKTTLTMIH